MPLPNFSDSIGKNIIRHIKYRGTIRTAEVIADNGDGTYDVKIALSDETYPNVETIHYDMVFNVGEIAVLVFEYGSKELPKIIGHGKKVAQDPVEVEVNYSGIARVETLNAYAITATTAYLEGRISLGGAGDCKTRGFEYGLTTAYGNDTHTDGNYGDGSYALQITSLIHNTTYHFRAYIIDENDDTIYGDDKTFTTSTMNLISCDSSTDKIYIHSGITASISSSFASPSQAPGGLAYDGTNLISCDSYTADKIYIHSGITASISSSFASPASIPTGLTYISPNLISCDDDQNEIYVHTGITSTIDRSFSAPLFEVHGLAYDGTNLISCTNNPDKIYIHSGITASISTSYTSPGAWPSGLAYDGTNLISCDYASEMIYIHSGITSTITNSFASPSIDPKGLTLSY